MSSNSEKKMRSWEADIQKYSKFKSIVSAHGEDVGETINELIENYIKEHGDGNPTYKITDFQDSNFIATPAFMRDSDAVRNYLEKIYGTPEWNKIESQLQGVWITIFNQVEASHIS
jgi:uncharacterized protein YpmS